jgi:exodeoxyribonuclease VII large subunit
MAEQGFFDMREKLTAPVRASAGAEPMSVTQVTRLIDTAIKSGVPAAVAVRGEVSNFNLNRASGHAYFTLKDPTACINCVMFRGEFSRVKFGPTDGMELLATGSVRVYAAQGRYQLYVNQLQPLGKGALELALAQLREKLSAEGLFEAARKRPIPRFAASIVIITSRETAALQDMLKVLRRVPTLRVMLYHVPVQGDGAAVKIAAAIELINQRAADVHGVDLILLGRGGGSLEDLWAFNEEVLARAMAVSKIPIVTGIGHETDVSIADLVADHWAHTPTEAATFAISHWRTADENLRGSADRLRRQIQTAMQEWRQRLLAIQRHEMFRRPTQRIEQLRMQLDDRQNALVLAMSRVLQRRQRRLEDLGRRLAERGPAVILSRLGAELTARAARLEQVIGEGLRSRRARIEALSAQLEAVNPLQVLRRGYTLTRFKKTGAIVASAAELHEGQGIVTRFHDGEVESTVEDASQPKLFEG